MKPYEQREPDNQYKGLLREILDNGIETETQQGVRAITHIAPKPLRFRFDNGFPLITERNMSPDTSQKLPVTIWQQAIAEICCFINGGRTVKELEDFGCYWWDMWATPEKCAKRGLETGDLGPGSYGAAFHDFPQTDGGTYNQFKNIIEQMKEMPHLRTHFISPWIPQYIIRGKGKTQKVVVVPCHGWIHFRVLDNKLTLHMFQRSGDVPVGVPSNMVQYSALLMMVAQVTGTQPYEYVHSFSDAHIYVDQLPAVETMLSRESYPFPTVRIDNSIKDIFSFRKEHFTLSEYKFYPGIKGIPVAI